MSGRKAVGGDVIPFSFVAGSLGGGGAMGGSVDVVVPLPLPPLVVPPRMWPFSLYSSCCQVYSI